MERILRVLVVLALVGAAAFWYLTRPIGLDGESVAAIDALTPDVAHGETMFWAGGCASCHAAPGATGDDMLVLSGGDSLASPFGTFYAPNISQDPTHGIGDWSVIDLANALTHGIGPDGTHFYPAFPYTSYVHLERQDIVDLNAFLKTLPADSTPSKAHDVPFPFTIRRGIGLWDRLFLTPDWVMTGDLSPELERGRYLVEGAGHCGECHTPRNAIGGLDRNRWLAGAANPSGEGTVPGLTPDKLDWSAQDIAYYLETGFTPDFDSAGGHMANVVSNMAHLPPEDRAAIAAYIKALPASGS
ncbi:c-type cytochrome [Chachezhania sediminis]|uniref:c-type cytochrome n=1 Tax=Chachezhania sediminis TaxID=2599291 RepID=UPI00131A894A|nr:cytochrome c [Chachezhania sediminis]